MGRAYEVRKASMMKTGAIKTKLYSKFGKEIYMAAKNNADIESNIELKRLVEKAKDKQVPSDVVKRAIEKAKGGKGENYEKVRYEGFGPAKMTVIVDCLTDNFNRTVSDVRNCFTKSNGKLGVSGSVSHFYESVSILSFPKKDEEELLDLLINNDCEINDIEQEDDKTIIYGEYKDLYKIKSVLENKYNDITFDVLEQTMLPSSYVELNKDDKKDFEKLMSMLEELDDVNTIYHNAKI